MERRIQTEQAPREWVVVETSMAGDDSTEYTFSGVYGPFTKEEAALKKSEWSDRREWGTLFSVERLSIRRWSD
jgi:hypothetical protein